MRQLAFVCVIVCCTLIIQGCGRQYSKEPIVVDLPPTYDLHTEQFDPSEPFTPVPLTLEKMKGQSSYRYNNDHEARDEMLGIDMNWNDSKFDIVYFKNLDVQMLEQLYINNFLNPEDRQNNSPSVAEIFEFMMLHPQVTASGYIVSPNRDDHRVSIDSLAVSEQYVSKRLKKEFEKFCENADELSLTNDLFSWWD
ncbi:hypothetical protein [Paenibacillus sp. YIM B09110]|uniref:hypothetical protein n=1 Tax=Paenibacillus sp. YIM B09110 TaxID=3126102 RepID=UPI00301C620A